MTARAPLPLPAGWLALLLAGCLPKLPPPPSIVWGAEPPPPVPGLVLRALHAADCFAPQRQALAGGDGHRVTMPVFAWVLQHPTQGLVVLDAAFPDAALEGGRSYPGKTQRALLRLEVRTSLVRALPDIGATVDDVRVVVVTHLHADHGGGIADLPGATWAVPEAEWAALGTRRGPFGDDASAWRDHGLRQDVPFDDGPLGPFDRHEDLFGDGSVLLLPTPGHTPGHVSILVNLPGQPVLLTGDAAWLEAHWQGPAVKGSLARGLLEDDWRTGVDALHRIRAWHERWPDLRVVAGHEEAELQRLPAWPATLSP